MITLVGSSLLVINSKSLKALMRLLCEGDTYILVDYDFESNVGYERFVPTNQPRYLPTATLSSMTQ